MGTHWLRDTAVKGRDEVLAIMPDFDLYRLGRVVRLYLFQTKDDPGADDYTMQIGAEHEDMRGGIVELEFSGMKTAKLPQMMPSFNFDELEIDDVSRDQLEGIRFRAKDHGIMDFEILCKAVVIRWRASVEAPGPA
jgi:hypothetical protein